MDSSLPIDAAPPPAVVAVRDMTVSYHRKPVLWDVDLSLGGPALIGILGPNGAGKSTLIKAILGLVPTVTGEARIFGKPYVQVRQRVAYVPQRESVDWDFPVTALEVALMGTYGRLGWFRRPGRLERQAAQACLQQVGLEDVAQRQIRQLSGGQQQRVFLARALVQQADLYLMDEPFAGVDALTEQAIVDLLRQLRAQGRTVIVVHHDLQTVREYFDQVVLLNLRLVAQGPTASTFTRENLQKTYGGRLTILDEAAEAVRLGGRR